MSEILIMILAGSLIVIEATNTDSEILEEFDYDCEIH